MGYNSREGIFGSTITTFTPGHNKDILYLDPRGMNLKELLGKISSHFGTTPLSSLAISAEHIQTDCIGYDKYDSGDYTTYICVERRIYTADGDSV